jgi:hypothetical protein
MSARLESICSRENFGMLGVSFKIRGIN